jgi:hypothetical protein
MSWKPWFILWLLASIAWVGAGWLYAGARTLRDFAQLLIYPVSALAVGAAIYLLIRSLLPRRT